MDYVCVTDVTSVTEQCQLIRRSCVFIILISCIKIVC